VTAVSVSLDATLPLLPRAAVDLPALATLAKLAGAAGVRVSVTEDLFPIGESDLRDLRRTGCPLELCIPPVPGLVKVALEARPERVILCAAPDRAGESPRPLDFDAWGQALPPAVRTLRESGALVAALLRPSLQAVKAAHTADLAGVELLCGPALDASREGGTLDADRNATAAEVELLADAAQLAAKLRIDVGVCGGLSFDNSAALSDLVPGATHCCVGRAFVERAMLVGVDRAVRDLVSQLQA
jgi:pyridoxine 5-phosphate synthase